ncbi:hypothetical protein [Hankyongella ginsenosidimutans]|uniref:hypothetical protein n=1 Tax=Hankyongella ginsenosidimutans TaxID=1763828 RepID=UPI001CA3821E|nr:hypothetical protein [Hankyongella ginsenosidimutans]
MYYAGMAAALDLMIEFCYVCSGSGKDRTMQRAHVGLLGIGGVLATLSVMASLNVSVAHSTAATALSNTPATVLLGYDPATADLPSRVMLCEKQKQGPAHRVGINASVGRRLPI